MLTIETTATIIVKPRPREGWVMVTLSSHSEIYFHGRQRALQFARAYAKLHRPARLRVLDETGNVEAEEIFAATSVGLVAYPVTRRANDPKIDDAKLIELEQA